MTDQRTGSDGSQRGDHPGFGNNGGSRGRNGRNRDPRQRYQDKQQNQGKQPGRPRTTSVPDPGAPFLNPYTFVPAFPRAELPGPLGENAEPRGHDRLHKGCWTGSIAVTLTVRTPLLLLDAARAFAPESGHADHLVHPVLTRKGKPHLPATSVKGMLRSAYEAITGSRFGVFHSGDVPLGWRRVAGDAPTMEPVRVSDEGTHLEFCESVRLPFYPAGNRRRYPGADPKHGDEVYVQVRSGKVERIEKASRFTGHKAGWQRGYVCITGENAPKKEYERVFLVSDEFEPLEITEGMRERWNDLMRSYGDAHDPKDIWERQGARGKPGKSLGREPGKLGWSPHLWQPERAELRPKALCYAQLDGDTVVGLYPVTISREIASRTPGEMLPEDLRPARDLASLSLADRVFGWVAPKGSNARPAAYRGRVRIGPVECTADERQAVRDFTEDFAGDGLPLSILSSPKPAQGRFYLSETASDPGRRIGNDIQKADVYLTGRREHGERQEPEGRGLRGRKVYWHHAAIADDEDYWNPAGKGEGDPTQEPVSGKGHREYRRPWEPVDKKGAAVSGARFVTRKGAENRDSQNRSVRGWVEPTTEFTFRVDIHDLDEIELGALVWLLRLPPDHVHRLGLGKPLGFGSVRLDIDLAGTTLHSGEQWASYYRSLSSSLPETDPGTVLDHCERAFAELLTEGHMREVKEAFLAVARGRADLPVHYPRVRPLEMPGDLPVPPDPSGRAYAWFTANEKRANKRVAKGHGQSLPGPRDDDHLVGYKEVLQPPRNGGGGSGRNDNRRYGKRGGR